MKSIAQLLVENKAVRTNFETPFEWTSGIRSPIYCDCRELISLPEAREQIIEHWLQVINEVGIEFDMVAGTATAGIPWCAFIADRLKIPMLYVRSKPKGHGAGKMVEGRGIMNQKILVVEDAFSTGGSSIKSADALRNELNAQVADILGIFSWDTQLAAQNAKNGQVKLRPLTVFSEIIEALYENNIISEREKESLERFRSAPATWYTG